VKLLRAVLTVVVLTSGASLAAAQQAQNPAGQPPSTQAPATTQTPPAPAPAAPAPVPVPGTVTCPPPVPPAVAPARAFNAPAGMLLHQVIPARSQDFEKFIAYVRDALAKTTNPTLREQAKGWTMWRTVEAGPNGDALYVFLLNPAVPCRDYGLSSILAEVYTDPAQLTEIWKLYTSSVRPMGSTLMNLVPVIAAAAPPLTPPTTPIQPPPTAKPTPPSAK
jgi:hypothetical protein